MIKRSREALVVVILLGVSMIFSSGCVLFDHSRNSGPDEFGVVSRAPLAQPPDFSFRTIWSRCLHLRWLLEGRASRGRPLGQARFQKHLGTVVCAGAAGNNIVKKEEIMISGVKKILI